MTIKKDMKKELTSTPQVYVAIVLSFSILLLMTQGSIMSVNAFKGDSTMEINIYHPDEEVEICVDIKGYEKNCDEFDLGDYHNPFVYEFDIEDPDKGDTLEICYELKDSNQEGCKEYDLTGRSVQNVDLILPGADSVTHSKSSSLDNNLLPSNTPSSSTQNSDSLSSSLTTVGSDSPSQNQQQQQREITWKTFADRDNLFTIQYPSNWVPNQRTGNDALGIIDFLVSYSDNQKRGALVNIVMTPPFSVFTDPRDLADVSLASIQNTDPSFSVQRQVECGNLILNGLPACDYIGSFSSEDGSTLKMLQVSTVDSSGTEFSVQYLNTPELFDHFYSTVKYIIESFKTTSMAGNTTS